MNSRYAKIALGMTEDPVRKLVVDLKNRGFSPDQAAEELSKKNIDADHLGSVITEVYKAD
jgi:hypothetical protein